MRLFAQRCPIVRQKGRNTAGSIRIYRGAEYKTDFIPKLKLEIAVSDEQVQKIVKIITSTARTGSIGDGKIFVYGLEEVLRIRTGELGNDAV